MEYTAKQENAINKLSARVVRYQMQIQEINNKIGKSPDMLFDEYSKMREKLKTYTDLLNKANGEIAEIKNQRVLYHKHLQAAKKHMDAAEEIKKRWL